VCGGYLQTEIEKCSSGSFLTVAAPSYGPLTDLVAFCEMATLLHSSHGKAKVRVAKVSKSNTCCHDEDSGKGKKRTRSIHRTFPRICGSSFS